MLWLQNVLNETTKPLQPGDTAPSPLLALSTESAAAASTDANDEDANVERPSERARVTQEAESTSEGAVGQDEGESVRILDVCVHFAGRGAAVY